MTLIDQRILVDAPPQVVWDYISDPDKITLWHTGYSKISVLTTQRTGLGTRRRCTWAGTGKDTIEEITAWVDGLGYEYVLIEGGPYRAMRARLRLQAVPDGTTVQWTVLYTPKGLFGTLKNLFGGRRRMQRMMAESLRQLRRRIDELGLRMDAEYRRRVAMRERLDAAQRAQYRPRHAATPEASAAEAAPEVTAPTPTQPQPPVVPPASVTAGAVPSFVRDLIGEGADATGDVDSHVADTEPKPPAGWKDALAEQGITPPPSAVPTPQSTPVVTGAPPSASKAPTRPLPPRPEAEAEVPTASPEPDYRRPTPPRGIPAVRQQVTTAPVDPNASLPSERSATPPTGGRPAHLPPPTSPRDTGEVSIWEVFGVTPPSAQDEDALEDLIASVSARKLARRRRQARTKCPPNVRYAGLRVGLRLRLMWRAVRVRVRHLWPPDEA